MDTGDRTSIGTRAGFRSPRTTLGLISVPSESSLEFFPLYPRGLVELVSPLNSTAPKQTFTVIVSDPLGYEDIDYVYFLVNDTGTIPRYTCHGYYQSSTGAITLYQDTANPHQFVEGVAGSGPPLSNGLCSLDPTATSAKGSGLQLTVNFALSLDPSYNNKNSLLLGVGPGRA
jgi:hypothetical protein